MMKRLIQLCCLSLLLALLPVVARADFIGLVNQFDEVGRSSVVTVRYDEVSRRETLIGPAGMSNAFSLARSPSGTLYTVGRQVSLGPINLHTINAQTGAATLVAPLSGPLSLGLTFGLAFSSSGTLYATDGLQLFTINPENGESRLVGLHTTSTRMRGLAFASDGALYGVGSFQLDRPFPSFFYRIDPATGQVTQVNPVGDLSLDTLGFRPDGRLFTSGVTAGPAPPFLSTFAELDPVTGRVIAGTQWTLGLGAPSGIEWIEGGVQPVPEPATLVLLGTGLAGVAVLARGRRMSKES